MVSPLALDAHLVAHRGTFTLDLDLAIAPGETVALLGPNGAGKTTALWCLAGLLPLADGHIHLGDRTLDEPARRVFLPPERRSAGVVFQDYLLFPHLSAVENVAFGLRSRGLSRSEARRLALDWLEQFGLADVAASSSRRLSGGQAQQVALARALALQPDLLLLDEPLAAMDVTTRARLRRSLAAHLAGHPGPRLIITHSPTGAFRLADRVIILEEGRATQAGTPDEIRRHPRTPYAADLAGVNLLEGVAAAGVVTMAGGHRLHIADGAASGPVLLTVHPRAVSLHAARPSHPINTWQAQVVAVESLGDRTRVQTGPSLGLVSEVATADRAGLGLHPGRSMWVSIDPVDITAQPA
jgi:molybdate transport system ATP-binding protein